MIGEGRLVYQFPMVKNFNLDINYSDLRFQVFFFSRVTSNLPLQFTIIGYTLKLGYKGEVSCNRENTFPQNPNRGGFFIGVSFLP
jgi:hypothetical protein